MLFAPRSKGLGKENFLTLNDKEEVTGLFRGELYTYKRHWLDNRSQECSGKECLICKAEPEKFPSFRFRINFVTTRDGQWIAKIFEGGGETYDLLTGLDKKFDLTKTVIDITRRGLKQNTKYDITPRLDQPVTKEVETKVKAVTLLALSVSKAEEGMGA